MANFLTNQIKREYSIFWNSPHDLLQAVLFFIMLMIFFPIALPYSPGLYREVFPGILWVSLSFAIFLNTNHFFMFDLECGYLSQCIFLKKTFSDYVYAKLLVNGSAILGAMVSICPLLAILYHLSFDEYIALNLSIFAIFPGVLVLCSLMASFSAFRQRQGVLLLIILFPLMLPFLIIGSMGLAAALTGTIFLPYLAIGFALSLLALTILPFIISSILKNGIQII